MMKRYYEDGREIKTRDYILDDELIENGKFIVDGEWADGHNAYSLLDANDEIVEEHQSMFVQLKHNGKMIMYRV